MEFTYTNQRPPAARLICRWDADATTNRIRLWRDDSGLIHYSRQYVSQDGSVSEPIEHAFGAGASAVEVARMIHWGCCGWSAGLHQIPRLLDKVKEFCDHVAETAS